MNYQPPDSWFENEWISGRQELVSALESEGALTIDLSKSVWIDPQPLLDLLLLVHARQDLRRNTTFLLPGIAASPEYRRALRYLVDSGFLKGLAALNKVEVLRDFGRRQSVGKTLSQLQSETLPPSALRHVTVVPCRVEDVSQWRDRGAVFKWCRSLKLDYLTGRAKALRIATPLVYHLKVLFDSVLPEFIDNSRIHKTDGDPLLFALYVRVRFRETRLQAPGAEPSLALTSDLNRRTRHLWQSDLVEALYCDLGRGIQSSWLASWADRPERRGRVPRLQNGPRVTGLNGDGLILRAVFEGNTSRLSPEERIKFELPTNLTGLHSVRRSIGDLGWWLSARSGRSITVYGTDPTTEMDEAVPRVSQHAVSLATPGVHYHLRIAADHGEKLKGWTVASQGLRALRDPQWWSSTYPARFRRAHVVQTYLWPKEAEAGDVVICRATHSISKNQLAERLKDAEERQLNLCFAEMPLPIALRLSLIIQDLIRFDNLSIDCPVVSDGQLAIVPGQDEVVTRSFTSGREVTSKHWWLRPNSAIASFRDIFLRCRQVDSLEFWAEVEKHRTMLLRSRVRWGDGSTLCGGFLNFPQVMLDAHLRKIVRRRTLALARLLEIESFTPMAPSTRALAEALHMSSGAQRSATVHGFLGSVVASGQTLTAAANMVTELGGPGLVVPVFVYPQDFVQNGHKGPNPEIRAIDWNPVGMHEWGNDLLREQQEPELSQAGRSGQIRRKAKGLPVVSAYQQPRDAYRTWQQQELIAVGHVSHNWHHVFVRIDLLSFLRSKASASYECIDWVLTQVRSIAPDAVFYQPNDVTEALLDELLLRRGAFGTPEGFSRLWPTSVVTDLSHLPTGTVTTATPDVKCLSGAGVAIVLHDVCVSGDTMRHVDRHLSAIGYTKVVRIVLLDYSSGTSSVTEPETRAWWSLSIPRTGTDSSCTLCRGAHAVAMVGFRSDLETVRTSLMRWSERWSHRTQLGEIQNHLRDAAWESTEALISPAHKVVIASRLASAVRALDLATRLGEFDFVCEPENYKPGGLTLEAALGAMLLFWRSMNIRQQEGLCRVVVAAAWRQQSEDLRSLTAVVSATLPTEGLEMLRKLLVERIEQEGLPDLHVGLWLYLIEHLSHRNPAEAREALVDLAATTQTASKRNRSDASLRARAVFRVMTGASDRANAYRTAIQVVGLPARGLEHAHIYQVLQAIKEAPQSSMVPDLLAEARLLLDPVLQLVEARKELFSDGDGYELIRRAIGRFDRVREMRSRADGDQIQQAVSELYNYLCINIKDGPSIRSVFADEYVHYIPFVIRDLIRRGIKCETIAPTAEDFQIDPTTTKVELQIFDSQSSGADQRNDLQHLDVVYAEKRILIQVLEDVLQDVEHSLIKSKNRPAMKIRCSVIDSGKVMPEYHVHFINQATEEQVQLMRDGGSWAIIRYLMEATGGRAEESYVPSRLELDRKLVFRVASRQRR